MTVIVACLPVLRVPALKLIRRMTGGTSLGTRGTTQKVTNAYARSAAHSVRRSGEWPLRDTASGQSNPGEILVKHDFSVNVEPMELEGIKDTYRPC